MMEPPQISRMINLETQRALLRSKGKYHISVGRRRGGGRRATEGGQLEGVEGGSEVEGGEGRQ